MLDMIHDLPALPARSADSNKGTYGRALVVAGSRGMSGAAVLAGSAALRGGAGLVAVAVPAGILPIVAGSNPCYLTRPLAEDTEGRLCRLAEPALWELLESNDVTALGPGLGRSEDLNHLVTEVALRAGKPLVLDADALNALAGHDEHLRARPAPTILTPHPGEFARLLGVPIPQVQADRQGVAARFAAEHGVVVLLKGHGTVVTDGRRCFINPTGNPGMATGGSGDVLTGLIAALVGQGLEPFAAAQLGAWWHGRAGDLARDALGEVSLIAADLLDYLPRAIRGCVVAD